MNLLSLLKYHKKTPIAIYLLVGFVCSSFNFNQSKPKIVGKKVPAIVGTTINGLKIDSGYFSNKVTLITFFYIGCPPCMNEIAALKKIKTHKDFQVLYIAPHTAWQMRQFNSNSKNKFSYIRNYYKAQKITFEILPECEKEAIRYAGEDENTLKPECGRISGLFSVFGYPATFIVDRNLTIKQAYYGFSLEKNDSSMVSKIQNDINLLLKVH